MALSEREQQQFDSIVSTFEPDYETKATRRNRRIAAVVGIRHAAGLLAGIAALIAGAEMRLYLLGAAGFAMMLAATVGFLKSSSHRIAGLRRRILESVSDKEDQNPPNLVSNLLVSIGFLCAVLPVAIFFASNT